MNGHIVGHSPFTLKLRNGKTWRWIQTWAKCTGRAKKTQNAPNAPPFAASADLQATSRDASSIPHRGYKLQRPPAHSQRTFFQVSSEPRSWGRGHSSPKRWVGPHTAPAEDSRRASPSGTPPHTHTPPQLGGAAASGTIPELQGGCRGRGREAAAPEQAAATASQSLLRSSAPTHPVLSIIAQLDFLAQAPRDLHSRRVRADAGILGSRRIAGGEAGGGGSGRRGLLALGSARAYVRTPSC